MRHLWRDLKYALRVLGRNPASTLVAVLTLALAIGATIPTFSIANAFLLRPLPFAEPAALVHLWTTDQASGLTMGRVSVPDYEDWKAQSRSFARLAAFNYTSEDLTGGERPERIAAARISADAFEVLGVQPALGRGFLPGEDRSGRSDVAVLSHRFWVERFAGDPGVLGETIEVNGVARTIVGVMPERFHFPLPTTRLFIPRDLDDGRAQRDRRFLQVMGRLRPGVSIDKARAEMETISAGLRERYPDSNRGNGVHIVPLRAALNFAHDIFRVLSVVLFLANLFVLLIACANVSSLLLTRALGRTREVAIRTALGASRRRLVGLFLSESLVLAIAGGTLGTMLALWLVDLAGRAIPDDLYRVGELAIDLPALLFALAISIGSALVFGLPPALRASRADLSSSFKEGGTTSTPRRTLRLQGAMVTAQVALAAMLLIGTGLMIRSFRSLQAVEPGFDARDILTVTVDLPEQRYAEPERIVAFHRQVVDEVAGLPEIEAAATVNFLPLNHESQEVVFSLPGIRVDPSASAATGRLLSVSPDYFRVLRIPLRGGRGFAGGDSATAAPVAIINDTLARRYFGEADPIDRIIRFDSSGRERTIVGVVGTTLDLDLAAGAAPQIYLPVAQRPWDYFRVVARTAGDPLAAAAPVREAIWRVDRLLPLAEVRSLEMVVAEFLIPQREMARQLSGLSAAALLIALVGIYGLIAFFVSQRRREIAVRMTLGARPGEVIALVLRRGLRLTVIGLAIGGAGALALSVVMSNLFYGVQRADPITFLSVPLLVLLAALLSCYIPARRAVATDPATILRCE
jgi:putative ABC transport system permease protein